jgi:hypothetical protein
MSQERMRLGADMSLGIGTDSPNIATGIMAQPVGSVIPGAVTAIDTSDALVYNTAGRYDINTMSQLSIRNASDINHNVIFHGPNGKEVGRFDFNSGELVFEGDAHTSAQVFTEWCRNCWNDLRDKDKAEVLQQAIDDMMHEASGELYSEEEKVAILTCMQIAQKIKRKHEGGSQPVESDRGYAQNLAKSMKATKEAVAQSVLGAIAPEGKSL